MGEVVVVQHVPQEGPGAIARHIRAAGHRMRIVAVHRGDEVPTDLAAAAGLVVMGGPMGVNDDPVPAHLRAELRALEEALRRGLPVLGICLGSQLLAHVCGAPVARHGPPEIGWYRLRREAAARTDPLFVDLPDSFAAFLWHGESHPVPASARHLASSAAAPCQAFVVDDCAYGLLFHNEIDAPQVATMVTDFRDEVVAGGFDPAAITAATARRLPEVQAVGDALFAAWVAGLATSGMSPPAAR